MGKASLRERMRQTREDAILDAARALMSRAGYGAMSMDELAAEVGVSKATLYQHFRSKEDLAVSVVVRIVERASRFLQDLEPAEPALDRLERLLRWVAETRYAEERSELGAVRISLLPVVHEHPRYQEAYGQLVRRLTELLEDARSDGTLHPAASVPVVVQIFVGLLRDIDFADLIVDGRCTGREVGDTLATVLLSGLRAPFTQAVVTTPGARSVATS